MAGTVGTALCEGADYHPTTQEEGSRPRGWTPSQMWEANRSGGRTPVSLLRLVSGVKGRLGEIGDMLGRVQIALCSRLGCVC